MIAIAGRDVRITNPDRILWPATGTTKRELLEYQLAIAPVLLPYLAGRAVMLWRFPEGVDGPGWFQANCRGRPDWLPTHDVHGRRGETLTYCVIEEPAALAWLANLGTIELHPFLWRIERPAEPTIAIFDLDPGPPADLVACSRVALEIRGRLAADGLDPVVKTSGGLGLHVAVPLAAGETFERTKAYVRSVAATLARELPGVVVERSARAERAGRVFVDWVQNDRNRQLVAPWSMRATPVPHVSTPVAWDDVERAARDGRPDGLRFGPREALDRAERLGDVYSAALAGGQRLPDVRPEAAAAP